MRCALQCIRSRRIFALRRRSLSVTWPFKNRISHWVHPSTDSPWQRWPFQQVITHVQRYSQLMKSKIDIQRKWMTSHLKSVEYSTVVTCQTEWKFWRVRYGKWNSISRQIFLQRVSMDCCPKFFSNCSFFRSLSSHGVSETQCAGFVSLMHFAWYTDHSKNVSRNQLYWPFNRWNPRWQLFGLLDLCL